MQLTALDGHYLNLPVMSDAGEIVGMVDVLKLTYATLDQINTMSSGEGEGPAWNKFWLSLDDGTESQMSGDGRSHAPRTPDARSMMTADMMSRAELERIDSVMPHDSASHGDRDEDLPEDDAVGGAVPFEETPFAFKFKAPSGRMHRLQVTAAAGLEELIANVAAKLGSEVDAIGGEPTFENGRIGKTGFALSYLDNEGDTVSITTNDDLLESIALARKLRRDKVDLFVHNSDKAPLPATLDPHPGLIGPPTPAESVVRERRKLVIEDTSEEEEEEEAVVEEKPAKRAVAKQPKQAEQVIAGVPNELLLPGAIATLAVVIIGVFAISRAGNK